MGAGLRITEMFLGEGGVEVLVKAQDVPNFLHFGPLTFDLAKGVTRISVGVYECSDND